MAIFRHTLLLCAAPVCLLAASGARADAFAHVAATPASLALQAQAPADDAAAFHFTLGVGDTLSIGFGLPPASGGVADRSARLSWRVDITNGIAGELVFAWQPGELDSQGRISYQNGFDGMAAYHPAALAFPAQALAADAPGRQRLVSNRSPVAGPFGRGMAVPEPAGLALFGLALLAMAFAARRVPRWRR